MEDRMSADLKARIDAYDLPYLLGTWIETDLSLKVREKKTKMPCWPYALRFIGPTIMIFYMTDYDKDDPETPYRHGAEYLYTIDGADLTMQRMVGWAEEGPVLEEPIDTDWAMFENGMFMTRSPFGMLSFMPATPKEVMALGFSAKGMDFWERRVRAYSQEVIETVSEEKIQELIGQKLREDKENLR
jgi:hypothetical protein